MRLKYIILLSTMFSVVRGYLYAEELRYINSLKFTCKDSQPFNVIKENGPLGYLPFLLARTGVLGNVVSLIHTLGDNLEKDGIEGFRLLFESLGVEREEGSSKVCIGDFLIYDCKKKSFTHRYDSGRLFTDTMVEVLEEGYKDFFDMSDQSNPVVNVAPHPEPKMGDFYANSKMIDLVTRLINSRYFLLHVYLYTVRIKSRDDFRALYSDIFSKMVEIENYNGESIFRRCFSKAKWDKQDEEEDTYSPLGLLISSGERSRMTKLPLTNGFEECRVFGLPNESHLAERCIYALAHCLCKGFGLELRDFVDNGDKDFQDFLKDSISNGHACEFDFLFKKKWVDLFKRINQEGCFRVRYKNCLEVRSGLVNIIGMVGNFFIKFLAELGLEGGSILELKKEYEELLANSKVEIASEGDVVGKFTGLATKMIRSVENEVLKHKKRNEWWDNRFRSLWVNMDFSGLRISGFNGELIGKVMFNYSKGSFKFVIICEASGGGRFPSVVCSRVEVSTRSYRNTTGSVSTGVPILDIFAEIYRQMVLRDLRIIKSENYEPWSEFGSKPITMLIRGDLTVRKHVGYSLLESVFKYKCNTTDTKKYGLLHRRIVEMIFNNFETDKYEESLCTEFLDVVKTFIGGIPCKNTKIDKIQ